MTKKILYTTGLLPREVIVVNDNLPSDCEVVETSGLAPDPDRWIPVLRTADPVDYVLEVIHRKYVMLEI
jgi:hypothetical protein